VTPWRDKYKEKVKERGYKNKGKDESGRNRPGKRKKKTKKKKKKKSRTKRVQGSILGGLEGVGEDDWRELTDIFSGSEHRGGRNGCTGVSKIEGDKNGGRVVNEGPLPDLP